MTTEEWNEIPQFKPNKYFTKYLPVEEEVKHGDIALKPAIPPLELNAYIEQVDQHEIDLKLDGFEQFKKLKLFLCSRDIQVKDELTFFWGDGREEDGFFKRKVKALDKVGDVRKLGESGITKGHIEYEMEKEGYFWNTDFAYKVIGEISSDALAYVKESDEFDEGDIKRDVLIKDTFDNEYEHLNPKGNEKIRELSDTEKIIKELPIKIKGPCGHFH